MSWWIRRPVLAVVALALLAGLGADFVDDWFHTDDGCVVETHCIACQRAVGSIGVIGSGVAPCLALERVGAMPAPPALALFQAPSRHQASRGPPQA